MSVWVFVLLLNLPSFGGEVTATVRSNSYENCVKLRNLVVKQFGGEENIQGSITKCVAQVPVRE